MGGAGSFNTRPQGYSPSGHNGAGRSRGQIQVVAVAVKWGLLWTSFIPVSSQPLGRMGHPAEVRTAAVFLGSETSFCTGIELLVTRALELGYWCKARWTGQVDCPRGGTCHPFLIFHISTWAFLTRGLPLQTQSPKFQLLSSASQV